MAGNGVGGQGNSRLGPGAIGGGSAGFSGGIGSKSGTFGIRGTYGGKLGLKVGDLEAEETLVGRVLYLYLLLWIYSPSLVSL